MSKKSSTMRELDPPEDEPGGPQSMGVPPEFQPMIDQITASVSQQAAQMAVNAIVQQLPGIVDQVVTARMGQTPQGQQANMQQPAGGMAGLMQNPVMAMLLQKFMAGDSQPNPMDSFTKQIEMLSNVITAVDRIRGRSPEPPSFSITNPKTALDWAKWGWQIGKQGGPAPSFDSSQVSNPPGPQV